jgi:hypothetical protein
VLAGEIRLWQVFVLARHRPHHRGSAGQHHRHRLVLHRERHQLRLRHRVPPQP